MEFPRIIAPRRIQRLKRTRNVSILSSILLAFFVLLQIQTNNLRLLMIEDLENDLIQERLSIKSPTFDRSAKQNSHRKWAYAFLMAGVDAEKPAYRGIFYNVLVSAEIMKESKADVILMVQMSQTSKAKTLTMTEEKLLNAMHVKIHYLDTPQIQNFYQIQFEKFYILKLTDYSRIIYMDGDVMPYCPMDYLFEFSDPMKGNMVHPKLKENIIIAWSQEPAHGGFFMLTPRTGDYELLRNIIHRREQEAINSPKFFDRVKGWGHVIQSPDAWHSISGKEGPNATIWQWHGDYGDQGLIYYWTKYFKKNVSIIIKDKIENWSAKNGSLVLDETIHDGPLTPNACLREEYYQLGKYAKARFNPKYVPIRDFRHFSGKGKPWEATQIDFNKTFAFEDVQNTDAQHYWFYILRKVDKKLELNLNISNLKIPESLYGYYPTVQMMKESILNSTVHQYMEVI